MNDRMIEKIAEVADWTLAVLVVVVVGSLFLAISLIAGYAIGKGIAQFVIWLVS